jgi:hypothetical protein
MLTKPTLGSNTTKEKRHSQKSLISFSELTLIHTGVASIALPNFEEILLKKR